MAGPAAPVATGRTAGYDVARAFAVLGMVLVNFRGRTEGYTPFFDLTTTLVNQLEGKAAALFVLLAGIGVSLRTRRARAEPARMPAERKALARRALVLWVVGLLNVHLWDWDILHVYGLYLVVAAGLLSATQAQLGRVGLAVALGTIPLQLLFPEPAEPVFLTPVGMINALCFAGNYPALPWLVFLIAGMALGRHDLRPPRLRRRLLLGGTVLWLGAELAAWLLAGVLALDAAPDLSPTTLQWLTTWPRPPGPLFVLSALGAAVAAVALCVELTVDRPNHPWTVALTATGQLALTLYFAHEVAILIPLEYGWLLGAPLEAVLAWGVAFFAAGVGGSLWWRARWHQGPLEAFLRQISTRSSPAWGGALVEADDRPGPGA